MKKLVLYIILLIVSVPLMTISWVLVDGTAECRLNNFKHKDFSGNISENIREIGPGRIDVASLSKTYERICIVQLKEPGYPYLPAEALGKGVRRVGRNICDQWNKNLVGFALFDDQPQGTIYVLATWLFRDVPKKNSSLSGQRCASIQNATIECQQHGMLGNGIRCLISRKH